MWQRIRAGRPEMAVGRRGCDGSGLSAMHLTGMLAYRFPIAVAYNMPTLAISWLGGAFAALAIVYVASREPMTLRRACRRQPRGGRRDRRHAVRAMAAMRLAALPQYRSGAVARRPSFLTS